MGWQDPVVRDRSQILQQEVNHTATRALKSPLKRISGYTDETHILQKQSTPTDDDRHTHLHRPGAGQPPWPGEADAVYGLAPRYSEGTAIGR